MKRSTMYSDKNGVKIKEHDIVLAIGKTKEGKSVMAFFILEFRWPSGNSDYYFAPVNYQYGDIDIQFVEQHGVEIVGYAANYTTPHVLDLCGL